MKNIAWALCLVCSGSVWAGEYYARFDSIGLNEAEVTLTERIRSAKAIEEKANQLIGERSSGLVGALNQYFTAAIALDLTKGKLWHLSTTKDSPVMVQEWKIASSKSAMIKPVEDELFSHRLILTEPIKVNLGGKTEEIIYELDFIPSIDTTTMAHGFVVISRVIEHNPKSADPSRDKTLKTGTLFTSVCRLVLRNVVNPEK